MSIACRRHRVLPSRPGQHERVVEALRPAIAAVHEEPGCELYAIHDAPDGTIVMIEKWTSVRELDDHGGGEAVRALNASLEGLLASPVEVTRSGAITSRNWGARPALTAARELPLVSACAFRRRSGWSLR